MKVTRRSFMRTVGAGTALIALPSHQALAAASGKQSRHGTLNMIVQPEPPVIVTAINQQAPTLFVGGKIYQSLLTYSFDLKPQPGLAKSWEVSDDGLTYTFHLEEGVKWHDGKPFTADDAVFSLTDMLPKVQAKARTVLNKYVASTTKVDDLTIRISLKEPFAGFILIFQPAIAPMMPRHIYEGTDYLTNPANESPIGTGPFMFKEWKRGSYIKLVKNPHYWKPGLPHLDELIFHVIPDSASRAVAFENKRIDVLRGGDVDNVDVKRLRSAAGVSYTTKGWEMLSPQAYLIFNMRKPPFDNVKVRQAIMYALNRKFIVKSIFFGFGRIATGPFALTELFYDSNVPRYDHDLKKAKQLMKESGIKAGSYTVRQLGFPYGPAWERLDEYTRQILEQLGFKVNLESTDAGGWASRTGNWDFDITTSYVFQYGDPAVGVKRLYTTDNIAKGSAFANVQGYSNPALDKVWAEAAAATDPAKRQALYTQIQTELVRDVANGFLIDMEFATLYRSNIKNLVTTAIGLNESFDNVQYAT